jgi:hypothetical protein
MAKKKAAKKTAKKKSAKKKGLMKTIVDDVAGVVDVVKKSVTRKKKK